jgi:hypothetical protein
MSLCKCKHGLWGRSVSRGPEVRALAKHFLADNLFETIVINQRHNADMKQITDAAEYCKIEAIAEIL